MENTSGIYMIKNKKNGKIYIGQTNNFKNRFRQHKQSFRRKDHNNKYFQRAWDKHGEENFEFSILEYCDLDVINEREYFWVNKFKSYDSSKGYNIMLPNKDEKKFTHSEETKAKIKGKDEEYSDDELISYLQEYFYHFGKVPTQRDLSGNKSFPNHVSYFNRFGSFQNALKKADLFIDNALFHRDKHTKEGVLEIFRDFCERNNRFPTAQEIKAKGNGFPTSNVISKFYSMETLREILGYSKETLLAKEKEESLEMLIELYKVEGKVSARLIDKSKITKSGVFYRNNFGGLKNACDIAGIPYAQHAN